MTDTRIPLERIEEMLADLRARKSKVGTYHGIRNGCLVLHAGFAEQLLGELKHYRASEGEPTHRLKKRGSEYVLIGYGKMQAENWREPEFDTLYPSSKSVDMREVAIYRSVDDGSLWVRPREEFEDGRFEALHPIPEEKNNG